MIGSEIRLAGETAFVPSHHGDVEAIAAPERTAVLTVSALQEAWAFGRSLVSRSAAG